MTGQRGCSKQPLISGVGRAGRSPAVGLGREDLGGAGRGHVRAHAGRKQPLVAKQIGCSKSRQADTGVTKPTAINGLSR